MKEMTLREIQLFSLEIFKEIHEYCKCNNLHYSLCGGSLLGAVRHHGFIPWDDDIDIDMPRQDYDFFCNNFRSSRFEIISPSNPDSRISFTRVCDMKITYVECKSEPWCYKQTGIWVDIFPMDGAPDNKKEYLRYAKKAVFWHLTQYRCRSSHANFRQGMSIKEIIKLIILKIVFLPATSFNKRLNRLANDRLLKNAFRFRYGTTGHWSQLVCPIYAKNEYHSIQDFSKFTLIPFENIEAFVFNGFHEYLSNIFGNYMQLPPINERIPKQANMKFYWK